MPQFKCVINCIVVFTGDFYKNDWLVAQFNSSAYRLISSGSNKWFSWRHWYLIADDEIFFFQIAILFEVQAGGEIFIDNLGAIRAFKTATFRCCKNATKIKSSKPFKRLWFEHLLFVCCRNATSNISFQVRAAWMKFSFLKARILPAASAAAFWSTTTA